MFVGVFVDVNVVFVFTFVFKEIAQGYFIIFLYELYDVSVVIGIVFFSA